MRTRLMLVFSIKFNDDITSICANSKTKTKGSVYKRESVVGWEFCDTSTSNSRDKCPRGMTLP